MSFNFFSSANQQDPRQKIRCTVCRLFSRQLIEHFLGGLYTNKSFSPKIEAHEMQQTALHQLFIQPAHLLQSTGHTKWIFLLYIERLR